ncbi:MAG: 5-formyltetrahydrofolate cyclo-ligase [Lachnospiraceae bacterium]|nr:5-formyltetrahydrofolate cyclo-ligase [Lachnospiraceae bacterium]
MSMETKAEIRKRILEVRKGLTDEEAAQKSEAIVQRVLKTPEYMESDNILLYADYNHEVATRAIFEDAIMRRKRVYFPKSDRLTNTMSFYQTISLAQLQRGFMGIPEPPEDMRLCYKLKPNEDTLVIIPGVAFDTAGFRLGYGRGFYDRFLSQKRRLSTMALAYACQIVDELPHEAHDIKMDKIVTEEIIYSFLRI